MGSLAFLLTVQRSLQLRVHSPKLCGRGMPTPSSGNKLVSVDLKVISGHLVYLRAPIGVKKRSEDCVGEMDKIPESPDHTPNPQTGLPASSLGKLMESYAGSQGRSQL